MGLEPAPGVSRCSPTLSDHQLLSGAGSRPWLLNRTPCASIRPKCALSRRAQALLPWWRAARGQMELQWAPRAGQVRAETVPAGQSEPGLFPAHCLCVLTVNSCPGFAQRQGQIQAGSASSGYASHPQARATLPQLVGRVRWCRPGHAVV